MVPDPVVEGSVFNTIQYGITSVNKGKSPPFKVIEHNYCTVFLKHNSPQVLKCALIQRYFSVSGGELGEHPHLPSHTHNSSPTQYTWLQKLFVDMSINVYKVSSIIIWRHVATHIHYRSSLFLFILSIKAMDKHQTYPIVTSGTWTKCLQQNVKKQQHYLVSFTQGVSHTFEMLNLLLLN